jgi:hypothetical protein
VNIPTYECGCGDGTGGGSMGDLSFYGDGSITLGPSGISTDGSAGFSTGAPASSTPSSSSGGSGFFSLPTLTFPPIVPTAPTGTPLLFDRASALRSFSSARVSSALASLPSPGAGASPMTLHAAPPPSSRAKKVAVGAGVGLVGLVLWGLLR